MAKSNIKKSPESKKEHKPQTALTIDVMVMMGLFLFAFVLYLNTLGHGFVLDDPLAIELNKNVTSGFSGISEILKGGYRENNFGGQLYRPISLIQFAIEWQISPNSPFIHHFFNVLWYALSVVLVYLVCRQWFRESNLLVPLAIGLIFLAHPIHTEVVANIKSRDEIMSLFFILAAFYSLNKYVPATKIYWLGVSIILYFLALISKESAVTMFPVFGLILWYIYGKDVKSSLVTGLLFFLPVILLFVIRSSIFGSVPAPVTDIMDNPIVSADGWAERFATSLVILWNYLKLLFFPYPLSSDYSYEVIPVVGPGNIISILSFILNGFLGIVALRGVITRSFLSMAIFSYFMAISLYSQIPMIIGTMFGERLAYLPSFWFIAGVAFFLSRRLKIDLNVPISDFSSIFTKYKTVISGMMVIVAIFSGLTFMRNIDWKDNSSLFIADATTYPNSVRLNNGAADQMLKAASIAGLSETEVNIRLTKAEEYCNKIMKIRPVATAYLTLGNIRMRQKRYEESISYYDQVNDLKNIVDINKALAYREMGRQAGEKEQNIVKSQDMLSKSISLNNQDAEAWYLMGVSYGVTGNHQKAGENFEKAYQLNPSPEYAKNVIAAYQYLGNQAKIAEYQGYLNKR